MTALGILIIANEYKMKIYGYAISDIARNDDGETLRRTQAPSNMIAFANTLVKLQFAWELLTLFSTKDRGDKKEKHTREYRDWMHLARDRFILPWSRNKLLTGRKWAKSVGLLIEDGDDFRIDVSVIPEMRISEAAEKPAKTSTEVVDTPADDQPAEASQAATTTVEVKAIEPSTAKPLNPEPAKRQEMEPSTVWTKVIRTEPVTTRVPTQQEKEWEKARKESAKLERRQLEFKEWVEFNYGYSNDHRMIWEDREKWGYQEFINPTPEPTPTPAPEQLFVSDSGNDGELW